MILDKLLTFSGGLNNTSSVLDSPTAGTQIAPTIIDLGVDSGVPSSANGAGARDIAIGYPMWLSVFVTTAFLGGTSLQLVLAGAPDNGSGAPGAFTTMWTSPAHVLANLDAGQQLANIRVPTVVPGQALPRYLRLSYVTVGTMTAGAVESQIVLDRDNQIVGTDGQYSGYPAGLTVAN